MNHRALILLVAALTAAAVRAQDTKPVVHDALAVQKAKDASMPKDNIERAIAKGMMTLRDDGARKVMKGDTSIAEILRVTQDDMLALE